MPATTTNLLLRKPLSTEAPDGAGQIGNLADDIEDRFGRTAASASALAPGTRVGQRALVGTIDHRWNGSVWLAWDSDWIDFSANVTYPNSGITFTSPNARYRYSGGKVHYLFSGTMSTFTSAAFQLGLPVARASSGGLAFSTAFAVKGSNRYQFTADFASTTAANFYFASSTTGNGIVSAMTGASPAGWAVGDTFAVEMTYDPA